MTYKGTYHLSKEALAELVLRFTSGDNTALECLYRHYVPRMQAYGISICGPDYREEVSDTIQEIFLWLARHYDKAAGFQNFEAYLFSALRRNLRYRLGIFYQDKTQLERYLQLTDPLKEDCQHCAEQDTILREQISNRDHLLHQTVESLPEYLREIVFLRYFQGLSYKEIGDIMQVNEQVARNYAQRAVKRLKEKLQSAKISSASWLLPLLLMSICGFQ